MQIENLLSDLSIVQIQERNYWVIRTEGGNYYNDFILHSYVALGWDCISCYMAKTYSEERIKAIIKSSSDDPDISNQAVGQAHGKINKFVNEIKKGDIVIIPSMNSDHVSIGEFIDDECYESPKYIEEYIEANPDSEMNLCPFLKRRRVKWLKNFEKEKMDIYLSKALAPQQAIYNASEYAEYVDRNIQNLYIKNNKMHSTFFAGTTKGLTLKELTDFVQFINGSLDDLSKSTNIEINKDDIELKLNIHSPGLIEIITMVGVASAGMGILLMMINSFVNGGKAEFKVKIGDDVDISGSIETPGYIKRKSDDKKVDYDHTIDINTLISEERKTQYLKIRDDLDLISPGTESTESTEIKENAETKDKITSK